MQSALTFTGICYLDVTHSEHAVLYRESKKTGAKIGRSNLPQKEWPAKCILSVVSFYVKMKFTGGEKTNPASKGIGVTFHNLFTN